MQQLVVVAGSIALKISSRLQGQAWRILPQLVFVYHIEVILFTTKHPLTWIVRLTSCRTSWLVVPISVFTWSPWLYRWGSYQPITFPHMDGMSFPIHPKDGTIHQTVPLLGTIMNENVRRYPAVLSPKFSLQIPLSWRSNEQNTISRRRC